MPSFTHDDLCFRYRDEGCGLPFVLQHGLGGDLNQPFGLYRPAARVRLIAFDMRGHGETRPLGDVDKLTIDTLADDLIALWDYLRIEQGVVGGISLGSAVAANVALRYPERVLGLVLSRPAWIDRPVPENVDRYATIARLIRELGPKEGLERFRTTPEFQAIERESPDCARSLEGQFEHPRAEECVSRLERLAADTPCHDRALYRNLRVPTLILGNHQDPIHPWALATSLRQLIPNSELREITPKSVSLDRHAADVQRAIDDFLTRHFLQPEVIRC
ncbi:MAG: alpha/beta fold hydrolase [Isosphaerales bacterium]